jgi:Domain of unknown function (DUF4123)
MANPLSYAQLKAALWVRNGSHVHAVVDGRVVPGLAEQLEAAQTRGWDCLQRGALSAQAAAQAAYIVDLDADAPFTDWLLAEAPGVYPDWGLLLISRQALLPMREHGRSLLEVITPEGRRRPWRWYDPQLLAAVLPLLTPSQQDLFFVGVDHIVAPGAQGWAWYAMVDGVLQSQLRELLVTKK